MTASRPPSLEELLERTQTASQLAGHLRRASAQAPDFSGPLQRIIEKIELHRRAERALIDSATEAHDARETALAAMRSAPDDNVMASAYFNLSRAFDDLAEQIDARVRHEATRYCPPKK